MLIGKPQVQLFKNESTGVYYIHAITWMNKSIYQSDGYEISTSPVNGVFSILLNISESENIPDLEVLTPVVHTFELTNVNLTSQNCFLEIKTVNTTNSNQETGKRKTHRDDADDIAMNP